MRSRFGVDNSIPFPGQSKLKCDQIQQSACPANSWTTVFDLTDGPGIITCLWLAFQYSSGGRLTPLTLEFDDPNAGGVRIGANPVGDPGIGNLLTGEMFGIGFDDPAIYRGPLMGVTNSYSSGAPGTSWEGFSGYIRLLMPYYRNCKFHIYNDSGSAVNCWAMVERIPLTTQGLNDLGLWDGVYLRTYGDGLSETPRRLTAYDDVVLLDEEGPISLAGSFMFWNNSWHASAGNNFAFLEGDVKIFYDQEANPSYRSSGMEDFYHGSWYFQEMYDSPYSQRYGIQDYHLSGQIAVPMKNNSTYKIAMQRFWYPSWMPHAKRNLKLQTSNGQSGQGVGNPGYAYCRWVTWYYK